MPKLPREWYQAMVERAPDAMLLVDVDGTILLVNRRLEEMFGYSREELLGRCMSTLVPERFRKAHELHRQRYHAAPVVRDMGEGRDLWGLRKDGEQFPVEISLSPLETEAGLRITAAVRDVTERAQTQRRVEQQAEELRYKNEELELFASVASHDLKAPLRHISALTRVVAETLEGKTDDELDKYIGMILESADRMRHLIDNLLALSRVGRKNVELTEVDLNAVLEEVLALLHADLAASSAEIVVQPLPTVLGNQQLLIQLLQNLIGNGLKFQAEGDQPRIEVWSQRHGTPQWQIAVKDNGIGIPREAQEKIFLPFERLHGQSAYKGSGIGLAICQRIVTNHHGGRMWLESEPGKGSTFWFTLQSAEAAESAGASGLPRSPGPKRARKASG